MTQGPNKQYLKDYQPANFHIQHTHLTFEIEENKTTVTNQMLLKRRDSGPLIVSGPTAALKALFLIDTVSTERLCSLGKDYTCTSETLTVETTLNEFSLRVVTELKPHENTTLLGLYLSGSGLCTQCEPEGFRNITFFLDRPDVMARYTTTIIADKRKYPVLLSNGNRVLQKDLTDGKHLVRWDDPFPKPSYLFALVAGDYGALRDRFTTMSGRSIDLEIYCAHGNESQCKHALDALKRSMKWDEDRYGREYDLDQYLILAVDDFNGGAMENKGLNIFNSRLIFADTETATDDDFERVEAVIAHEYFHNWTGNRITLRDWFQLSLKEGLTVFREQHYMSDLTSESVKRIDNVEFLREKQFPEDAGPNAHPVRPESCFAVDNFYTVTVYEKGAEVIRILKQLIGPEIFKKGMDYYFRQFDGQAVTIEHFLSCFEAVSGKDLKHFRLWYSQAGTPRVKVDENYDPTQKVYTLKLSQSCPATPDQETKQPFVIPFKLSLFSPSSKKPFLLDDAATETVIELSEPSLEWKLNDCPEHPIPSLLRGFTAPVHLDWNPTIAQLEFLARNDTDGFNQWECLQKLAQRELTGSYSQLQNKLPVGINKNYVTLFETILVSSLQQPELASRLLELPSKDYLVQTLPLGLDPEALSATYERLEQELAQTLNDKLWALEEQISAIDEPSDFSFKSMGRRRLRKTLWKILGTLEKNIPSLARRFDHAKTMNEQECLLNALNSIPSQEREVIGEKFAQQWKDNTLVINKWLTWEASFNHSKTLDRVIELSKSSHFKASNPNKVRALYGAFATTCWRGFHRIDGAGYEFFKDRILEVDALNPQTAARLCQNLENWYRLDSARKTLLQKVFQQLLTHPKLSKNSYEIIKRSSEFHVE